MTPALDKLADRIDRLTAGVGRAVAWLALVVVLLQFALVVARYIFGLGSIWLSETVFYANAAMFLLASAWTLGLDGHVRVDVFYAQGSTRAKAVVDLIGSLALLLPFAAVLIWLSVPYAARSWAILERSQEASGLPLVFVLKSFMPAFAVLMALQGIAQAIRAMSVLRSPPVTPGLDPGIHPSSQDGLPGHLASRRHSAPDARH